MVVVAVAGGTGSVGRTIVDELRADGTHEVLVLARKVAAESERNLIAAAAKSTVVKRFVQSNWGDRTPEAESLCLGPNYFRDQSVDALRQTDLEWTRFHNGLFLDYYGMTHVEFHLAPLVIFVDIALRTAAIPGSTGDELMSFTYTKDLAKFVVAALTLGEWDEVYPVYSDQASLAKSA